MMIALGVLAAQPLGSMEDPLFGISYDTQKVHFESVPVSLVKQCSELQNRYIEAWIYGQTKTEDTKYVIISGLMNSDGENAEGPHPDVAGIAVSIHGTKCVTETADGFLWGKNARAGWNIPESVLADAASDILHRYTKAFGGKKNFLENVKHREYLAPVMRKQLEIFEREP